jgi:MYXO-CTERM domain-containing protein
VITWSNSTGLSTGATFFLSLDNDTPPPFGVPGPLPLFGAAAAFGVSRRLRQRIASTC